jgi:uncharacterized protein (UPF0276 family)
VLAAPPPWPQLGFGVGLRTEHYADVLGGRPPVDWFEAITENYMDTGGRPLHVLESVRRDRPVALHGVGLSIGSVDPLSERYLERLSRLVERIDPALVTDHLCWTGVGGQPLFDLLPLPYTEESLAHVVERVERVQERLGRRILLENASTYVTFAASAIPEHEFLAEVAQRADCGILLDVNNVHVSATNHGFDPAAYVDFMPAERVGQIHLAGFTDLGAYLFDTHSAPVSEAVWGLYARVIARLGPVSTLVEWDADIPPWARLCEEVARAREVSTSATQERHDGPNMDIGRAPTVAGRHHPRS